LRESRNKKADLRRLFLFHPKGKITFSLPQQQVLELLPLARLVQQRLEQKRLRVQPQQVRVQQVLLAFRRKQLKTKPTKQQREQNGSFQFPSQVKNHTKIA
jgi:hypothetical protein